MKLPKSTILAINIIIALIGALLVFTGVTLTAGIARILLESIGTSLIAAGAVNFFDRFLTQEASHEGAELVTLVRASADESIYAQKYRADKVDIVGVSLRDCMKDIIDDTGQKMINRILNHHARFRLLLVHPDAAFIHQRALKTRLVSKACVRGKRKALSLESCFTKGFNINTKSMLEKIFSTQDL